MPKAPQKTPPAPGESDIALLTWLATCVSVFTFLIYFKNGQVLLYGDAIAHINIARRVFDSRTPGLLQLGTVWLPLPHLLMIPFLVSMKMWQTGAGGSIPSMAAYVFGVVGIFRLTRATLSGANPPDGVARAAAWIAAIIYAANPNLMYMQSTAMGESVYLAFFIWTLVYFERFLQRDAHALTKCGLCLFAACLTRYDGWFLAAFLALAVLLRWWWSKNRPANEGAKAYEGGGGDYGGRAALKGRVSQSISTRALAPAVLTKFLLIVAAAPALWLAYNGVVYRNPLEFENGPYSAKAIERRTQSAGNPSHPGSGNIPVASMFFLKAAENNVASNEWLQRAWIGIILAAIVITAFSIRRDRSQGSMVVWLVLLIPLPFYALSIASSGVPIFVPQWWPFSHYNVRYGLQLLPTFCAAIGMLAAFALRHPWDWRLRFASVLVLLAFVLASYSRIWLAEPICLQEAEINMKTRNQLEIELAHLLGELPPGASLLMYLGDHVGAVERAGIPLKQTINEGNHRVWKQPTDTQGLWERALADPTKYADYVLAFEGDPVWLAVQNLHLRTLVEIHVTGQARAVLYRVR